MLFSSSTTLKSTLMVLSFSVLLAPVLALRGASGRQLVDSQDGPPEETATCPCFDTERIVDTFFQDNFEAITWCGNIGNFEHVAWFSTPPASEHDTGHTLAYCSGNDCAFDQDRSSLECTVRTTNDLIVMEHKDLTQEQDDACRQEIRVACAILPQKTYIELASSNEPLLVDWHILQNSSGEIVRQGDESSDFEGVLVREHFLLPPQEEYTLVLSVSDQAVDSQFVSYRVGETFGSPVRGEQLLKVGETIQVLFSVN